MKQILKNNAIYIVALIVLVIIGLFLRYQKKDAPVLETEEQSEVATESSLSIDTKAINEENFSGKVAVISGNSDLAKKAQSYIDQSVADFKKTSDTEVPAMREQYGDDSNPAQYEIDIDAKHLKGTETESIIIMTYAYTGGAHGSSIYKVITASLPDGKILSLSDIIKKEKEGAFVAFVKNELLRWRPEGSVSSPVFPEEVGALTFSSFANWSQDDKNLILYFSQYEIGPGVLGPVAFPLSKEKIKDFLK